MIDWLLESDPAIRWQVLRDLADAGADQVAAERDLIATQGWGAQLLAAQDPSTGAWDGGCYRPGWAQEDRPFFDAWSATHFSLALLRDFGADPDSEPVRRAVALVRDDVHWYPDGPRYFDGETEPCVNGMALASGAYFGQDVEKIIERVLGDQLPDGGWNCWAEFGATVSSFHSTLCVLEGLLEWERAGGSSDEVSTARQRGDEYLLQRKLFRRMSTGGVADPRFTLFSFPTRWYYDALRALEYFRVSDRRDERCADAIDLMVGRRDESGRWPLENTHQGPTLFDLEGIPDGFPSRWNTLRALRVLRWWEAG